MLKLPEASRLPLVRKSRWSCSWVEFPSDRSSPRRTPKSCILIRKNRDTKLPLGGIEGAPPTILCPGLGSEASGRDSDSTKAITQAVRSGDLHAPLGFMSWSSLPLCPAKAKKVQGMHQDVRGVVQEGEASSQHSSVLILVCGRVCSCSSAEDKTLTLINRLRYNVESLVGSGS